MCHCLRCWKRRSRWSGWYRTSELNNGSPSSLWIVAQFLKGESSCWSHTTACRGPTSTWCRCASPSYFVSTVEPHHDFTAFRRVFFSAGSRTHRNGWNKSVRHVEHFRIRCVSLICSRHTLGRPRVTSKNICRVT